MRRIVLALIALFALGASAPAQNQGQFLFCNNAYQVSQGATALTKIVTGVAGSQITLCGWAANAGAAAGTFQLRYGTGTNCGTGTVSITPAVSLGINGVYVDHTPQAFLSLPGGATPADLCLVTTGTGPIQLMVYYTIQ